MNNINELETYLIGDDNSYLKNKISSGKITMISGKWGSGKTHFWENRIRKKIDKNIYISLFGKKTIQDIENEILTKSFILKNNVKVDKNYLNYISSFCSITKNITNLIIPKSGDTIDKIKETITDKLSNNFINSDTIICFDDFERKSKNIDLNELFGFINQLTINTQCKTIIILNSEVFQDKDKKTFIEVKEKTISKYLHFEPTVTELFEILFSKEYSILEKHKKDILYMFIQTNIINARIILQVLTNLKEWCTMNKDYSSDKWIKIFVLVNIHYILYHIPLQAIIGGLEKKDIHEEAYYALNNNGKEYIRIYPITKLISNLIDVVKLIPSEFKNNSKFNDTFSTNIIEDIKLNRNKYTSYGGINKHVDKSNELLDFINTNQALIQSWHFINSLNIKRLFDSHNQAELDKFNNINSFITTGICKVLSKKG
jgi:hypothetical protein